MSPRSLIAVGVARTAARQRPQIDDLAVAVEKGVGRAGGGGGDADDVAEIVQPGRFARIATERAQIRDRVRRALRR